MQVGVQLPVYSPVQAVDVLLGLVEAAFVDTPGRLASVMEPEEPGRVSLFGSGTQALRAALEWHGTGPAEAVGAVALPAYSCFDLVSAAVGSGRRVAFYDLDPSTLLPDLEDLGRVIDRGVSHVVVAPLLGFQPPWDQVRELCKRGGALLIEDAAQSHGSFWRGHPAGSIGDASVFSFGRGKGWTGGGGGALITRLGERSAREAAPPSARDGLRSIVTAASSALLFHPIVFGALSRIPALGIGETRYHPPEALSTISAVAAGVAMRTRNRSAKEAEGRRARGDRFAAAVAQLRPAVETIGPLPDTRPGYLRFPLRVDRRPETMTGSLGRELFRLGVRPGYPRILPHLEAVRELAIPRQTTYPGARDLVRTLITLPSHSRVTSEDFEALTTTLSSAFRLSTGDRTQLTRNVARNLLGTPTGAAWSDVRP